MKKYLINGERVIYGQSKREVLSVLRRQLDKRRLHGVSVSTVKKARVHPIVWKDDGRGSSRCWVCGCSEWIELTIDERWTVARWICESCLDKAERGVL